MQELFHIFLDLFAHLAFFFYLCAFNSQINHIQAQS
jgi:hypothetical protein